MTVQTILGPSPYSIPQGAESSHEYPNGGRRFHSPTRAESQGPACPDTPRKFGRRPRRRIAALWSGCHSLRAKVSWIAAWIAPETESRGATCHALMDPTALKPQLQGATRADGLRRAEIGMGKRRTAAERLRNTDAALGYGGEAPRWWQGPHPRFRRHRTTLGFPTDTSVFEESVEESRWRTADNGPPRGAR